MLITVMRNTECLRVSFGTVMYGEARVAPEDKFDFATGICVAMIKANDKLIENLKGLFYSTYWKEFELADPYVELVMKHQRNYNREIAARRTKSNCSAGFSTDGEMEGRYFNVYVSPLDYIPESEGTIALKHALALKKDLEEESKWQKTLENEVPTLEWEDLPWPLETHVP